MATAEQQTPEEETHDIYTDPALIQSSDDPVVIFVQKHWQRIVSLAIAAGIVWFVVNSYQSAQQASVARSSALFTSMRSSFTDLEEQQSEGTNSEATTTDEAKTSENDKLLAKFNTQLESLSETKEPYAFLEEMYKGLHAGKTGDLEKMNSDLKSNWQNLEKTDSKRLLGEVSDLAKAKLMLDSVEKKAQGLELLQVLSTKAIFVSVPAAITLSKIASTDEEKANALGILEELSTSQPEQLDLIQPELDRLKGQS